VVDICHKPNCLKSNYLCPLECNAFECGRYLPTFRRKIISRTVATKRQYDQHKTLHNESINSHQQSYIVSFIYFCNRFLPQRVTFRLKYFKRLKKFYLQLHYSRYLRSYYCFLNKFYSFAYVVRVGMRPYCYPHVQSSHIPRPTHIYNSTQ
jgi:hypothetical protein